MPGKRSAGSGPGQPKKKQPRLSRLSQRQALANLTELEAGFLRSLLQLRYLRTDQVHALIYPDKTRRYAQQRLNILQHRELICAVKVRDEKITRAYWHLSELGLRVAEELEGIPEEERTKLSVYTVSATYVRHFTDAVDIYVDLAQRGAGWEWRSHRERYQYDNLDLGRRGERPLYLVPDATIDQWYGSEVNGNWEPQGYWRFYLELDRSTMSHSVMRTKFEKYRKWFGKLLKEQSEQRNRYAFDPDWNAREDVGHYVLVICPGPRRAQNLQELLNEFQLPGLAVTKEQAVKLIQGGLPEYWCDRRREIKAGDERRRIAYEERERAKAAWQNYDKLVKAWDADRDRWATEQYDKQLIKMRNVESFRERYAVDVRSAPAAPAVPRPQS